jgi:hypothetical protein
MRRQRRQTCVMRHESSCVVAVVADKVAVAVIKSYRRHLPKSLVTRRRLRQSPPSAAVTLARQRRRSQIKLPSYFDVRRHA